MNLNDPAFNIREHVAARIQEAFTIRRWADLARIFRVYTEIGVSYKLHETVTEGTAHRITVHRIRWEFSSIYGVGLQLHSPQPRSKGYVTLAYPFNLQTLLDLSVNLLEHAEDEIMLYGDPSIEGSLDA